MDDLPSKTSLNCAKREFPAREPAGPLAAILENRIWVGIETMALMGLEESLYQNPESKSTSVVVVKDLRTA